MTFNAAEIRGYGRHVKSTVDLMTRPERLTLKRCESDSHLRYDPADHSSKTLIEPQSRFTSSDLTTCCEEP